MALEVIHNYLSDPGDHCSLLLVRQDSRTIEIVRCDDEFVVVVTIPAANSADASAQNVWCRTLDEAAAVARSLVKMAEPEGR